jgi:23S rRNA pseudouridine1911/1915/1917 synthase
VQSRKRYIVPAGPRRIVRDVLLHAGADPSAIVEGRVFVGRKRIARDDVPVGPGDVVEIAPPLEKAGDVAIALLARTEDLVAVDKPAGVPTIADHGGAAHSLAALTARALGLEPRDLHPTSRLDRDVSGVVVFALTAAAASRLMSARSRGEYERLYVAIASRAPEPAVGAWDGPIGRGSEPRLRKVNGRDPAPALTRYAACGAAPGGQAMLAVAPMTGRTHQIRVHAAHAGAPLLGDKSYGGSARVVLGDGQVLELGRIALHAQRVRVPADPSGAALTVLAPVPNELRNMWTSLGGDASSWDLSMTCA